MGLEFRAWNGRGFDYCLLNAHHMLLQNTSSVWFCIKTPSQPDYINSGTLTEMGPAEIEQYVGLKDETGKKIFVGDILKVTYTDLLSGIEGELTGKVVHSATQCGFKVELPRLDRPQRSFRLSRERYKVMGNVHENPELLKVIE